LGGAWIGIRPPVTFERNKPVTKCIAQQQRNWSTVMSRAFVKELDDDAVHLPDRPISPHRNFVTAFGMATIESNLDRFEAAQRTAIGKNDKQAIANAQREVRYWRARRANAELVKPPAAPDRVAFATTVTLRQEDGREQTFKIVGEDEADPSRGTVSYISPVARAATGCAIGDSIELNGRSAVIVNISS
jgi:transcription elongation GreA/GreB family factor